MNKTKNKKLKESKNIQTGFLTQKSKKKNNKAYNGFRLKYYANEHNRHEKEYAIFIDSQDHVTQIAHKLCRHFGVPKICVNFIKCRQGSACYRNGWGQRLDFSWGKTYPIDVATICHEMGHYYLDFNHKPHGHTKKLTGIVDRMLKYCGSKNYWGWSYTLTKDEEMKLKHPIDWRWNNLTLEQRKGIFW
jgi:hypothetical protein